MMAFPYIDKVNSFQHIKANYELQNIAPQYAFIP